MKDFFFSTETCLSCITRMHCATGVLYAKIMSYTFVFGQNGGRLKLLSLNTRNFIFHLPRNVLNEV